VAVHTIVVLLRQVHSDLLLDFQRFIPLSPSSELIDHTLVYSISRYSQIKDDLLENPPHFLISPYVTLLEHFESLELIEEIISLLKEMHLMHTISLKHV